MATPRKPAAPKQPDPDAAANARVMQQRQARIDAAPAPAPKEPAPESAADTPLEFLSDEFDRKNFGDPLPTVDRIVYGPDTLLDDPAFKERVEKYGVKEVAEASAKAIIDKGALAFPNPQMQSTIARAIRKFGVEAVAKAMFDRVMRIPVRTVTVEIEREDEMLGNPLREAVQKYGSPGMAPKFMSDQCIAVLGMRGYQVVRQPNGDPVKVGTLIMTEIPQRIADQRSRHYAEESRQQVREAEEAFEDNVARAVAAAGAVGAGSRPLRRGELMDAAATEAEDLFGQQRAAGITLEGQV